MSNVFSGLVRLVSDPEVRFIPSGKSVLTFKAASSTGYGDKKKTLWLRITYWNNAEKMATLLSKGDLISIAGELSMSEYKANDGSMKTALELTANIIDLVGKRNEVGAPAPISEQSSAQPSPSHDDFDDIPF